MIIEKKERKKGKGKEKGFNQLQLRQMEWYLSFELPK